MDTELGQTERDDRPLVPRTAEAREYHDQVYRARARSRLDDLNNTPLSVFVCGPSQEGEPLTAKKLETVDALAARGYDPFIGEPEVAELEQLDRKQGNPIKTANVYERIIAESADAIIIYCASPGSIAETHDFLAVDEIARKTCVFVDKAHAGGYSANGLVEAHRRRYGMVEEYRAPDDIVECRLKGRTIEIVGELRTAKWLKGRG